MQLLEENSWSIFAKYAFHDRDARSKPDHFKEIGMKIVIECKGLPLALKAIGSLLYTKSSFEEWTSVLMSEKWDMSNKESDIFSAWGLSYYYLPSIIKRGFDYCSVFPKGSKFAGSI
ncbi:hypothetical protein L6164_016914 [Bauhinia variegata]|uniref:Uncharacterized protein n=1 Tax=Bauhinia variegata TaxID=167791 RepID=A0ACB9NBA9_BAUVA|nr:hypothetical protein L6164_016914 [Bauhinia variegata]